MLCLFFGRPVEIPANIHPLLLSYTLECHHHFSFDLANCLISMAMDFKMESEIASACSNVIENQQNLVILWDTAGAVMLLPWNHARSLSLSNGFFVGGTAIIVTALIWITHTVDIEKFLTRLRNIWSNFHF